MIWIVRIAVNLFVLMVVVNALMTWSKHGPEHPLVKYTAPVVEPLLKPIRKLLDPIQKPYGLGIDLSPVILLLLLAAARKIIF